MDDTDDTFFAIFPKNIFGVIPPDIIRMLNDSGFQNLVTIITLTDEDITEMETSCNIKLKLGHRRLLLQMVEYAKKLMPEVKPSIEIATIANTSTIAKEPTKNENEENIIAMLKRNIKKKTQAYCKMYNAKYVNIVDLTIVKSSENEFNGAQVTCSCGETVKICTSMSKKSNAMYWIMSNFTRHLIRYHLPQGHDDSTTKNDFQFVSSNGFLESDGSSNAYFENDFEEDMDNDDKKGVLKGSSKMSTYS